nr:hypothetical protein [Candidatus Pantoea persica]
MDVEPQAAVAQCQYSNAHGAWAAVEHLVAMGHRQIGLLNGPKEAISAQLRDAWREALAAHQLPDRLPTSLGSSPLKKNRRLKRLRFLTLRLQLQFMGLLLRFGLAHRLQFFRQVATLFRQIGVFDDVLIHAIFIVGAH